MMMATTTTNSNNNNNSNDNNPRSNTYLGNSQIKRDGVQEEWTPELLAEYKKCSDDPIYFIENYMKIITLDHGLTQIKLWDFQKNFIKTVNENRFVVALAARQSSKSTTTIAYILWYSLFNPEKTVFILANKGDTSRELFSRLVLALENIPFFLQPGMKTLNKGSLEFSNNTKIMARATSSSSIRGSSANCILLDEFSFVNDAESFMKSTYPVITAGTTSKVIVVSTPNGVGNAYHTIWTNAVQGTNEFVPFTIKWDDVPGRDEKFKETTIKNIGQQAWEQEFECSFLGSGRTLINSNTLLRLKAQQPILTLEDGSVNVYKKPIEDHTYMIFVDVSRGVAKDFSTFQIIDVTEKDNDGNLIFEQVCVYRNNIISPLILPSVIYKYAQLYNNAYCIVESNNNGESVANSLFFDLEYENLYSEHRGGRLSHGLETTKKVKGLGCVRLKDLIEKDHLRIHDKDTIKEMTHFVEKGQSYAAEEGNHDDLVMPLVLFAWFTNERLFEAYTDISVRNDLYKQEIEQIENELLPFGVIDDRIDEPYDSSDIHQSFFDWSDWSHHSNLG